MVADTDSSLIVKLLENLNRFINRKQIGVIVTFVGKVLANCENLSHLGERKVQLVHLFVSFFESFQQVLDLELNSFVLLVGFRIFLHFLHLLDILADAARQLQDWLCNLHAYTPHNQCGEQTEDHRRDREVDRPHREELLQ